jgi:hypothetical protein
MNVGSTRVVSGSWKTSRRHAIHVNTKKEEEEKKNYLVFKCLRQTCVSMYSIVLLFNDL